MVGGSSPVLLITVTSHNHTIHGTATFGESYITGNHISPLVPGIYDSPLLLLPSTGVLGTVGSSRLAGLAFRCTSTAASVFFKSCNCNSSIATGVGFAIIFPLNSLLAWIMKHSRFAKLSRSPMIISRYNQAFLPCTAFPSLFLSSMPSLVLPLLA
ncbi:hypothetical protein JB92DRAFT_2846339 [Gautieria morchelliformis]|nr:hypothetical protein JB92DRAFT_2846339 [Gautieria morchelliformis]